MKLLFDTHTFIWWDSQTNKLSQTALELLQDRSNILLLSVVGSVPVPTPIIRATTGGCPYKMFESHLGLLYDTNRSQKSQHKALCLLIAMY